MLGAIGGVPDKKRVALAHLLFNLLTGAVALAAFPLFTWAILTGLGMADDPTTGLAIFHTLFNLVGVALLTPFIPVMARNLNRFFRVKEEVATRYIHLVDVRVPEAAFVALRNEVSALFARTLKYALLTANVRPSGALSGKGSPAEILEKSREPLVFDHKQSYDRIKGTEAALLEFLAKLGKEPLDEKHAAGLEPLFAGIRECAYAAKTFKDIRNNLTEFAESEEPATLRLYGELRLNLLCFVRVLTGRVEGEEDREAEERKLALCTEENRKLIRTIAADARGRTAASLLNTNRSLHRGCLSLWEASSVVNIRYDIESEE